LTSSKPAVGLQYQQPVFCTGGLKYYPKISAGKYFRPAVLGLLPDFGYPTIFPILKSGVITY